jgi:VanZ family protein
VKRFAVYVLPIVLWAGTIFYLSSQSKLPKVDFSNSDKVMHAGAYAIMGALLARALSGYGYRSNVALLLGMLFGSIYGATDEVHQLFTPGRSPDVADWIADTVGAGVGAAIWAKVLAAHVLPLEQKVFR